MWVLMLAGRYVVAGVLLLVGLILSGQGLGLIPGSFMTGQSAWLVIGVLMVFAGGGLAWWTWRSRSSHS